MKQASSLLTRSLIVAVIGMFVLAATPFVSAQQSGGGGGEDPSIRENRILVREERREVTRERLSATKLELCQTRETGINTIFSNVIDRSEKRFDHITKLANRVQDFYANGTLTVDNYNELVADVDNKEAAARLAIDALKERASFKCDTDGPRADIQDFRNQRLNKVDALGEYRTSVRTLIDAILADAQAEEVTNE